MYNDAPNCTNNVSLRKLILYPDDNFATHAHNGVDQFPWKIIFFGIGGLGYGDWGVDSHNLLFVIC